MESLRCVDQVVVLDSGSVDRTVELATNLGARIVEQSWPGYANQKNRAADPNSHDPSPMRDPPRHLNGRRCGRGLKDDLSGLAAQLQLHPRMHRHEIEEAPPR